MVLGSYLSLRKNDTYIRQDPPFSIFRRVLEALHVEWRNSTPRFCLDTRANKWKYKSKLFFYFIEWGSNQQPVDFTVTLCAPARDQWWKYLKNRLTFENIVSKILEEGRHVWRGWWQWTRLKRYLETIASGAPFFLTTPLGIKREAKLSYIF